MTNKGGARATLALCCHTSCVSCLCVGATCHVQPVRTLEHLCGRITLNPVHINKSKFVDLDVNTRIYVALNVNRRLGT